MEVAFPERPGAALARADRVDRAALLAVVEDTVAVGLFTQGSAAVGDAGVNLGEFGQVFTAVVGDGAEFLVVDPDVTGSAGATVAAAGAFKAEAVLVPGI